MGVAYIRSIGLIIHQSSIQQSPHRRCHRTATINQRAFVDGRAYFGVAIRNCPVELVLFVQEGHQKLICQDSICVHSVQVLRVISDVAPSSAHDSTVDKRNARLTQQQILGPYVRTADVVGSSSSLSLEPILLIS